MFLLMSNVCAFVFVQRCRLNLSGFEKHHIVCFSRGGEGAGVAGQVKLSIGYSIEESRLYVTVHSCRSVHQDSPLRVD